MDNKFELVDDGGDLYQSVQGIRCDGLPTTDIEMKLQSDTVEEIDYHGQQQPASTKSNKPIHPLKLMVLKHYMYAWA